MPKHLPSGTYRQSTQQTVDKCLRRILDRIDAVDGDLTAADAARLVDRSASWIRHHFTTYAGMTFRIACLVAKLARGAQLLRTTKKSIAEITIRLGYTDRAKFEKSFKKIYGVTPFAYRQLPSQILHRSARTVETRTSDASS
jgi:transcriptional regulator GlxA family with amidase domain